LKAFTLSAIQLSLHGKNNLILQREFGVAFVTTEPPLNMWNSIDSLAGAYNIKVAIHEHWKGVSHYWNPTQH
jgi:hypothetical protein